MEHGLTETGLVTLPGLSGVRFMTGGTPLASTISLKCPAPSRLIPLMLNK